MAASRIFTRNAFETALDGGIDNAITTITLDSVIGLSSPGILVFNDDSPTLREYVEYTGITSNDLTGCTRGLTGSAGGIPHPHGNGDRVRSVYTHQIQDRIWDDIEDLETADTDHVAAADPHTGYLKEAGGTMTGDLVLDADPDAALKAATKQYVDARVTEGTWTPTLEAGGTNPSVTYLSQSGLYLKIGGLVTIWWTFVLDVVSAQGAGTYQIAGMPFNFSAAFPTWQPIGPHDYFDSTVDHVMIARKHSTSASLISMIYDNNGDGSARHMSDATVTLATDDTFQGQGTYLTDD